MSAEQLSDDMSNWPSDPFALLGVSPGASDADIKRAYTRLVRRFKPEHHPDQFRRIREAYEFCQERAAWYRTDPAEVSLPPPPTARPTSPPADAPYETVIDPAVRPAPAGDPVEEAWELAIDGREAEAYSELVKLHESGHSGDTLPLRLYWLLAVNPTLDAGRTRHHWLADALARSGLRGPAVELYRRELETEPADALESDREDGPYFRALTAAPASAALGVVRWRVSAAGRLGRTRRIRADLTALRDSVILSDEAGWLGLLVQAAGWAAWTDNATTRQFIAGEIADLSHLQLSQSALFDRMEEVEQVAKDVEWGRYSHLPMAVHSLLQISFADSGYARPAEVEAAAVSLAAWGLSVLEILDSTFVKRPAQLLLLGREFDHYLRSRGVWDLSEIPDDRLRGLARQLGVRGAVSYIGRTRLDMLRLLIEHAVHPREMAAALGNDPEEVYTLFAPQLHDDLTLYVAWLAGRVVSG